MRKNIVSIVLLLGMVAFNASVLCNARCASKAREAQISAVVDTQVLCQSYQAADGAVAEGGRRHAPAGAKCVFGMDGYGAHLDYNFNLATIDLAPTEQLAAVAADAHSLHADISPAPQDRPPRSRA